MSHARHIRILIVDDHPAVREGLAELIGTQTDMCVVGLAGDGVEAVALFEAVQPDVTLLDMRLPGLSGLDALRLMRRPASPQGLIAMSNFQDQQDQALRAGAHAFLLKESFGEELLAAIRAVYGGPRAEERDELNSEWSNEWTETATPNQS